MVGMSILLTENEVFFLIVQASQWDNNILLHLCDLDCISTQRMFSYSFTWFNHEILPLCTCVVLHRNIWNILNSWVEWLLYAFVTLTLPHLAQFSVVDELWTVSMNERAETQTIFPAETQREEWSWWGWNRASWWKEKGIWLQSFSVRLPNYVAHPHPPSSTWCVTVTKQENDLHQPKRRWMVI